MAKKKRELTVEEIAAVLKKARERRERSAEDPAAPRESQARAFSIFMESRSKKRSAAEAPGRA